LLKISSICKPKERKLVICATYKYWPQLQLTNCWLSQATTSNWKGKTKRSRQLAKSAESLH